MNKVIMKGRLTAEPETTNTTTTTVTRFNIAVDRRYKKEGQPTADFHSCVAFGNTAEFISKYFTKGSAILIDGTLQNNNYEDKSGIKHYGYNIIVNEAEFCEKKADSPAKSDDGFMTIPDGIVEELPFK